MDLPLRHRPFVRCVQHRRSTDVPIGAVDLWDRARAFCDRVVGVRHGQMGGRVGGTSACQYGVSGMDVDTMGMVCSLTGL